LAKRKSHVGSLPGKPPHKRSTQLPPPPHSSAAAGKALRNTQNSRGTLGIGKQTSGEVNANIPAIAGFDILKPDRCFYLQLPLAAKFPASFFKYFFPLEKKAVISAK
jgi:hypothetical protein